MVEWASYVHMKQCVLDVLNLYSSWKDDCVQYFNVSQVLKVESS